MSKLVKRLFIFIGEGETKMRIILCLICLTFLSGCITLNPFTSIRDEPRSQYEKESESTITPRFAVNEKTGKVTKAYEKRKYSRTSKVKEEIRYGFFKRIQMRIASMGALAFIILIAGVILFPSVVISWLSKRVVAIGNALKQTVKSIKESNAKDTDIALHDSLKINQTEKTKKIVGNIKAEL